MKSRGFPLQYFFLRTRFVNDVSKFFVDGFRGIDSSPVNRGVQFITQDEAKPPDRAPWNTELRLGVAGALDQRFFAGRIDDVRVYDRAVEAKEILGEARDKLTTTWAKVKKRRWLPVKTIAHHCDIGQWFLEDNQAACQFTCSQVCNGRWISRNSYMRYRKNATKPN